jgi:hypothetical protein
VSAASRLGLVLLAWLVATPASAHMGSTKYLFVTLTPDGASVLVEVDRIDVGYELDLDDPESEDDAALLARSDDIGRWLAGAITLRDAGGACTAEASPASVAVREASGGPVVRVVLTYACPTPRTELVLHDEAVFAGDPQHEALVRIEGHEASAALVLRRGRQDARLGDAPSTLAVMRTFLVEGALHLVTGYDHILFLITLLLASGELAARKGARFALRDVAVVVTGFTLGHTVTLIAAALDVVTLPSRLVESAIALSIAIVAVWNLVRSEARAGLPWVAFAFGLVHGFGFSSVLRDLVLPAGDRVAALLSFNLGIELAQLGIVVLAIAPLAWAGRERWYRRVVIQGGSVAITLIALHWLFERALG